MYFYFGKNFGASTNFETLCTMAGAGKISDYFKKIEREILLVFVLGLIIEVYFFKHLIPRQLIWSIQELTDLGFANVGTQYFPDEIFSNEIIFSLKGFLILIYQAFVLVLARYAGGCTSGHAITGLSSFQLPSLLAVINFFIGVLLRFGLIPLIFRWEKF